MRKKPKVEASAFLLYYEFMRFGVYCGFQNREGHEEHEGGCTNKEAEGLKWFP